MKKVLVIEDDPQVQELVCAILSAADIPAEAASNGLEALDRLGRERFDLALIDIALPGMDGLLMLERLNEIEHPPRAIMMTADQAPETVLRALRAEACRYITKPINARLLVELVQDVLELPPKRLPIEVVSARPDWVELLVPCTIEAAERGESFLSALQNGASPEVAEAVGKAVHELMLNAIEWGGKFDPDRRVRISCVRTPRLILYRIADPGPGFRFDALTHAALNNPPDQPAEHQRVRSDKGLRPGGFGLLIARALVDDLIYNEVQNEVILIKHLG